MDDLPAGALQILNLILTGVIMVGGALLRWSITRHIEQYDEWRSRTDERIDGLLRDRATAAALREGDERIAKMLLERLRTIEELLRGMQAEQGNLVRRSECQAFHRPGAG